MKSSTKTSVNITIGLTVIALILGVISFFIHPILIVIVVVLWAIFCLQAAIDPQYFISRTEKDME